jgi:hypothetical protein
MAVRASSHAGAADCAATVDWNVDETAGLGLGRIVALCHRALDSLTYSVPLF